MRRTAITFTITAFLALAQAATASAQSGFRGAASGGQNSPGASLSTVPAALQIGEGEELMPTEGPTLHNGEVLYDDGAPCCDGGGCSTCGGGGSCQQWLSGVYATGWLDQGYTWNPDSPANRFNTPVTYNDRSNEYQLNQAYLSVARDVDRCGCTFDLGGRVDILWGSDYFFTTSSGLETRRDGTQRWNSNDGPRGIGAPLYGVSMPQLYAEAFLPIWQGFSVKMGHFYSNMGYESVMAPQNFFYSHSYMFQYGESHTYTGLMTTFQASRGLKFHSGFHRGWDAWRGANNQLHFAGGVEFTSIDDRWNFAFHITHGHEDEAGSLARTGLSTVLNYHVTPCFTYVFQYNYGAEEGSGADGSDAQWFGINQYLLYKLNYQTQAGLRVEWFRDVDNARVLGIPDGSSGEDYVAVSLGLNMRPCNNIMLRPELRWDWSDVRPPFGRAGMFNVFSEKNQFLAAVDLIWRF